MVDADTSHRVGTGHSVLDQVASLSATAVYNATVALVGKDSGKGVVGDAVRAMNETANFTTTATTMITNATASSSTSNFSSSITATTSSVFASTTTSIPATKLLSTTDSILTSLHSEATIAPHVDGGHPMLLMVFCTFLFLLAVVLIARLMLGSNKRSGGGGRDRVFFFSWPDRFAIPVSSRWRGLSTAQSTSSIGLISAPVYTAMPQAPNNPPIINTLDAPPTDARLDWERQFFDDDAVYRPTNSCNDGVVTATPPTRLQFNFNLNRT